MESTTARPQQPSSLELFYRPLRPGQRGLCFPCGSSGQVDLDSLSDRERRDYLYARAVAGHDLAWPVVRPTSAFPFLLLTDLGR